MVEIATEHMNEAARLQATFTHTRATVDADPRMTDEGKREAIHHAHETLKAGLGRLAEAHHAAREQEIASLRQQFVGPPAQLHDGSTSDRLLAATSFRDAMDRAAATAPGSDDLGELIRRAELIGDRLLGRAALTTAFERRDLDALNIWLESHPHEERHLQRLFDLERQRDDLHAQMDLALVFSPAY